MLVFAIETSCDETSVAILKHNKEILSHITYNQTEHKKFGGVVPEIASRAHLEILQKIIPKALKESRVKINDIDLFCATCGPGLIGGLLVGSTFTKSLAIGTKKPFYPINHLEAHLLSPTLNNKNIFPCLSFLLTGGHTQIYFMKSIGSYKLIGETVDDAIGESFDKVGKILGLEYPGGPKIEKWAKKGNNNFFELPHPFKNKKNLNFSFSGIKTAVNIEIKKNKTINKKIIKDMSASFQNKIIEILKEKIILSLEYLKNNNKKIKNISIVGGVASNEKIKKELSSFCKKNHYNLIIPPKDMFSDNAAMIGWACIQKYYLSKKPDINFKPDPRLSIY